jgi:hypothetical protein
MIDGPVPRGHKYRGCLGGSGTHCAAVGGGTDPRGGHANQYRDDHEYHEHFRQREAVLPRRSIIDRPYWAASATLPRYAYHASNARRIARRAPTIFARCCAFSLLTFFQINMRLLSGLVAAILLTSCRDPRAEANIAEAMVQVGTEISGIRQDYAVLQSQVDSLRGVVARQDTLLTRLATLANVPLPPK